MLFSFLIASVSTGPTSTTSIEPDATSASPTPINITNGCGGYGFYGAVDHAFLVTLKPAVNSDGSLLNTTEDKLSFLQGWVDQYTADQLEANSKHPTHVWHFFTETQFAVAVDASDEVRGTPSTRAPVSSRGPPRDAFVAHTSACSHQTTPRGFRTGGHLADDPRTTRESSPDNQRH